MPTKPTAGRQAEAFKYHEAPRASSLAVNQRGPLGRRDFEELTEFSQIESRCPVELGGALPQAMPTRLPRSV